MITPVPGEWFPGLPVDALAADLADAPELRAALVPKWKPSTAYASGEFVLNPSGQIVQANTAFTSGTSYSGTNWTVVSGGSATDALAYMARPTVVDQGLWVAPGGNDSNDGLSPGSALATLDAALAKLPTGSGSRGHVTILPGTYTLAAGVSRVIDNVEIVGLGNAGQSSGLGAGPGGVTLIAPDSAVGLTFGDATNRFRGPIIRNIHIKANSAASLGGLRLRGYSNFLMERVVASGFTNGYGIQIDASLANSGATGATMYGELVGCGAHDCKIGLDNWGGSGVTLFGGTFDNGANNAGVVVASSVGIQARGPNAQIAVYGTRIQSYSTGIDLPSGGGHDSQIFGVRIEGFDIGIQTDQPGTYVNGGEFVNNLYATAQSVGTIGTAFKTLASSSLWRWMPARIASVATEMTLDGTAPGVFLNSAGSYSSGFGAVNARHQVNTRGNVIGALYQAFTGQTADIVQIRNLNGTGKGGVLAGGTMYSDDAAQGLVLKDTANHYWRVTVSTAGVLTTADLGTTKPTA
jgi:hypothetical protein